MRLFRWLLRLYPQPLRQDYGEAMAETLARRLDDARRVSGWRMARVWAREMLGALGLAIALVFMERILRGELRYAARRLWHAPAFTVPAAMTLALAIGANASIFAIVHHVVLNPLPYPDSGSVIVLDHGALGLKMPSGVGMSEGLYFQYLDRAHTLEHLALYNVSEATLTGGGEPERIRVTTATPSLVSVLRLSPTLGRWFTNAEGEPGAARVVVLSHGLWMRRYGGDARIIGRAITLQGLPAEVIGVMPPASAFPDASVDAWAPTALTRTMGFGAFAYSGVARMRAGVTLANVRADLDQAIATVPDAYPEYPKTIGYNLHLIAAPTSLKDAVVGSVARVLSILFVSVGLVLVIACANVANLFLVRADAHQRDVAIRRALGADGSGVAGYFLAESLLLATCGGVIGLGIAYGAVQLLVSWAPAGLPRLEEVRVDGVAAVFTMVVTAAVALAFGVLPLLRAAPLVATLHSGGRAQTVSLRRHRLRQTLMGAQVALALVLLVFSGLMVRSFQRLRAMDPGFDARSALTFRIGLPTRDYPDRQAMIAAHHALLDRLAALPGVTAASATSCLPLAADADCFGNTLFVAGRPFPKGALPAAVSFRAVAGNYFAANGIRLLRGRGIERGDVERADPVVVINRALARAYFPKQDPLGQRIASSRPQSPIWLTVIGIAADTPSRTLVEPHRAPAVYMPMSIARGPETPVTSLIGPGISVMSYVLRSTMSPESLVPAVRRAIRTVDANLPIVQMRTLQDMLDRASAYMAFTMVLLAIAASVALLLGTIGIYGVMSYIVSQRGTEIGLRLALGAEPRGVVGMILRQGGLVTIAGIVVGLVAAFASSRMLGALLYEVRASDPVVFAATTLALLVVALIACWLPARRAARQSPLDALRAD